MIGLDVERSRNRAFGGFLPVLTQEFFSDEVMDYVTDNKTFVI